MIRKRSLMIAIAAVVILQESESSAQNSSLLHAPLIRQSAPGQLSITQPQAPPVQGVTPGQGVTASGFPATQRNPSMPVMQRTAQPMVQLQPPNGMDTQQPYPGQPPYPGQGPLMPSNAMPSDRMDRPRVTIADASWTYQPPPPLRVFRKNDLLTIRVDEITRVMAEGTAENRKRTLYEAILTDWIRLTGFKLRPAPQIDGDPAIGAESNAQYRAESTVESRESLAFNIAATVVDIRPNGMLVIEGTKSIRVNDNLWETAISGLCRAQDVGPDNVVLSKDLIDLEIKKLDRGHLRDGYKRGWIQRAIDRVGPF